MSFPYSRFLHHMKPLSDHGQAPRRRKKRWTTNQEPIAVVATLTTTLAASASAKKWLPETTMTSSI
jgi:hypothetical protein